MCEIVSGHCDICEVSSLHLANLIFHLGCLVSLLGAQFGPLGSAVATSM